MKKNYSTPSISVYKMEIAEMLMSSGGNINSVSEFNSYGSNSMTFESKGIEDNGGDGFGAEDAM